MPPFAKQTKNQDVTAILGPTNTGKTHMAIERMLAHGSGLIGLPLRLLAREVYGRVCEKLGAANVSLVTGEERITPQGARFQICTVEAMPDEIEADFVAIDEIQLAATFERGHFFTDRLLNLRGRHETLLLGADTMTGVLSELLPGINIVTRPRMSVLSYAGSKKITRMPSRTAIVAFSVDEVYAIAELVRRERGGAAIVTGSLSPRTRNAQVALYQSGDVDFLVATDAIGMGLNLNVNHVAFAQDAKFDGFQYRKLTAAELAQVAGRAGRHMKDGTFGVTSRVQPFDDELVDALESHLFAPVKVLTWRNRALDFSSVADLQASLDKPSPHPGLMKTPGGTDRLALDILLQNSRIHDLASTREMVKLLWEIAKTPDYRKISPTTHAEILSELYTSIAIDGFVREDWFADLVERADNITGELDTLTARIASIRTCTYISNRDNWLENTVEWREKTRDVENRLSDALHELLTKRFIDRRTSVLMKRLKENRMPEAEVDKDGSVSVEGHKIGSIAGFRFSVDSTSGTKDEKALIASASKALAAEIEKRAGHLAACPNSDVILSSDGLLRWTGQPVAKLGGGPTPLTPRIIMFADEHLTGKHLEKVVARLERWLANHVNTLLKPLSDLKTNTQLNGIGRGIAYQLVENLGILPRHIIAGELKTLDQEMRGSLRQNGVRFGAYHVFIPALLKPASTELLCLLWAVHKDKLTSPGLAEIPAFSAAGRTSFPYESAFEADFYQIAGFRILGKRAVRIDILERLADIIRPITNWKPDSNNPKPEGAFAGHRFFVTPAMMSILGTTHEDMESILKALGYRSEQKPENEVRPEVTAKTLSENTPDHETVIRTDLRADIENTAHTLSATINPDAGGNTAQTREEAAEPATILVWHYGKRIEKPASSYRSEQQKKPKKPRKGQKKPQVKSRVHKEPARSDKKPDPNSPFAALAALRKTLESGND